jgi:serine protease
MSEDNSTTDRRSFLAATGAAGAGVALAPVASADEDEPDPREEGLPQFVDNDSQGGERPGSGQLVVGISENATVEEIEQRFPPGTEVVGRNDDLNFAVVEPPERQAGYGRLKAKSDIAQISDVKYTEDNRTYYPLAIRGDGTPSIDGEDSEDSGEDPLLEKQYAPQQVRAPQAWTVTEGSEDVTVAVIDQGVKYDHPDLKEQFGELKGRDFVDDDPDPMPESASREYHGTHVAGIASATTDNGEGMAGISNSRLLSCRALGTRGGSVADIADAIQWAADQGADIINMSLGGGGFSDTMKAAVSYAKANGTLSICAAGNDCKDRVSYPAAYNECVAVSALDSEQQLASFSNYGEGIDVAGPGVNVLSCWTKTVEDNDLEGKYERISGTSMACPAVAGVAALAKAANPEFGPSRLRQHLRETAVDVGLTEREQGAGRADAARAVGAGGDGSEGPTAEMEFDPLDPHVGEPLIAHSRASTDPDGYIDEWTWEFGDAVVESQQAYHKFEQPGEHEISLTVTDDQGNSDSTSTTIEVQRGRCGDQTYSETFDGRLNLGQDINRHPYLFETDEPCRLHATIDGASSVTMFVQQQITGFVKVECGGELTLTPSDLRELDLSRELSVGALSSLFGRGEYTIAVEETGFGVPDNEGPEAKMELNKTTVEPGEQIELDASGSSDPDGRLEQYVWTFGDVAAKTGESATYRFDRPGEYAVTLEVTDDRGATDSVSEIVTVGNPDAGPACSDAEETERFEGNLDGPGRGESHSYTVRGDGCVRLDLTAPQGSDFDLYVTFDGRTPDSGDYDDASFGRGDGEEMVLRSDELVEDELGIYVHSADGGGAYSLQAAEGDLDDDESAEPPQNGDEGDDEESDDPGIVTGVTGVVYDQNDEPIEDAVVMAGEHRTRTNADGEYELALTPGKHRLTAQKDGYRTVHANVQFARAQRAKSVFFMPELSGEDTCSVERHSETREVDVRSSGTETLSYAPQSENLCAVDVHLEGPDGSDFDLYVNTDGTTPDTYGDDYAAETQGSDETITVEDLPEGNDLTVLVQAFRGEGGTATVEFEEFGN